jgi:hypothetical protein
MWLQNAPRVFALHICVRCCCHATVLRCRIRQALTCAGRAAKHAHKRPRIKQQQASPQSRRVRARHQSSEWARQPAPRRAPHTGAPWLAGPPSVALNQYRSATLAEFHTGPEVGRQCSGGWRGECSTGAVQWRAQRRVQWRAQCRRSAEWVQCSGGCSAQGTHKHTHVQFPRGASTHPLTCTASRSSIEAGTVPSMLLPLTL